jgi:hypothetical protein
MAKDEKLKNGGFPKMVYISKEVFDRYPADENGVRVIPVSECRRLVEC